MAQPTPTLGKWLAGFGSLGPLALLRFGALGGVVVTAIVDASKHVAPGAGANAMVCGSAALGLGYPAISRTFRPHDDRLVAPVLFVAGAYLLICAHYMIRLLALDQTIVGYEAYTDAASSLLFVLAWWLFSRLERDAVGADADQLSIILLGCLLLGGASAKAWLDASQPNLLAEADAARLAMNTANAGILFGLYSLMRRIFPAPDPLTHCAIVLLACAQLAASGTDCLRDGAATAQCDGPVASGIAHALAWVLLAGKGALGVYASYVYFNGRSKPGRTMP